MPFLRQFSSEEASVNGHLKSVGPSQCLILQFVIVGSSGGDAPAEVSHIIFVNDFIFSFDRLPTHLLLFLFSCSLLRCSFDHSNRIEWENSAYLVLFCFLSDTKR